MLPLFGAILETILRGAGGKRGSDESFQGLLADAAQVPADPKRLVRDQKWPENSSWNPKTVPFWSSMSRGELQLCRWLPLPHGELGCRVLEHSARSCDSAIVASGKNCEPDLATAKHAQTP